MILFENLKKLFTRSLQTSTSDVEVKNIWDFWQNGIEASASTSPLAMKISTVYRCVNILSTSVAMLPLELQYYKDGVFTKQTRGDLPYLLGCSANGRQSSFELIENAVVQLIMNGNAYIYPRYTGDKLTSLTLLSPNSCSYDEHKNEYVILDYINKISETVDGEDIIHIRNMTLDGGYRGVSTITYGARCLGISANADERSKDSFKPGNLLRGFVTGNNNGVHGFGEVQSDQLKNSTSRVEKELNSGKNIFHLSGDMRFEQLSISPTDLQLLETRKFGVLEICRFFGVHPDKVFAGQSQNYKASEMSNVSFLSDTLNPLLTKIESAFNTTLIGKEQFGKMRLVFNREPIFETDLATMGNYMEKTIQNGIYSVNYWRAKHGQQKIEGGDQCLVSCNVAPIDSAKIKGDNTKTFS